MAVGDFPVALDFKYKTDIMQNMRKRAVERMDVAHLYADRAVERILETYGDATSALRIAYTAMRGGALSPSKLVEYAIEDFENYQFEFETELDFDELNALRNTTSKRKAFDAFLRTWKAICVDKELYEMFMLFYILADNCYLMPFYDIQVESGVAFEPTGVNAIREDVPSDKFDKMVEWLSGTYFEDISNAFEDGFKTDAEIATIKPSLAESQDFLGFAIARQIHTETTDTANEYQSLAAKEMGIEHYIYLTEMDDRVCPICGGLNQKRFPFLRKLLGLNFPPMHPNCRCQTVPDVTREKVKELVDNGSLIPNTMRTVVRDMGYEHWLKAWGLNYVEPMTEDKL